MPPVIARYAVVVWLVGCALDTGSAGAPIQGGAPATAYPEAVVVTSDGFIPCSGVLLAANVVLSAGHCRGKGNAYVVSAPNANNQTATGSNSWSPFAGDPKTSPDVMLVFLDSPINLSSYPTLSSMEVAPGTTVVDIGRTLNGDIGTGDNVSPPVTIQGDAAGLGLPFNYRALPDISEAGDSGGPIMLQGTHTIVAIVDTDTIEQQIPETTPIDMFARIDVVKADIDAQIALAATFGTTPVTVQGGCAVAGASARDPLALLLVLFWSTRRRTLSCS